jgi:hypothetical protein
MTDETKNLLDVIWVGINSVFAIAAFGMTLWINARNLRIENRLKSINLLVDKETDLKFEAKRIATEKSLALMVSIDSLFEKLKGLNDSTFKEVDYYLRIALRKEFFESQIYLPNEISNAVFQFLAACIRATGHFALPDKYWDIMDEVSKKYTELTIKIRRMFYFETTDLAPMVEKELSNIEHQKV